MADDVDVAEVAAWAEGLAEIHERIAWRFARSEPRERVAEYVRGLLAPLERKNGWTLAEQAGEGSPDGMQRLLYGADWDADAVRDDLRDYVIEHLGAPDGILVLDETGFLKKGTKSAGVARQYSGTAGRVESCQVGVFATYVSPLGRALVDRDLYLTKEWAADAPRRAEAAVPVDVEFATKPALGAAMLKRAVTGGLPAGWATGDEVYGRDPKLRQACRDLGLNYVLVVPANQHVRVAGAEDGPKRRADEIAAELSGRSFRRRSAGDGAKGPRLYDWARVAIQPEGDGKGRHWLLIRRSIADPTELAYYLCDAPAGTTLRQLVRVAGARWAIEECFQTAKGEAGLDQYQVRRYDSWYRHITLAMFAHAFLTVTRAQAGKKGIQPQPLT
jgi:SRSO17 transposase